MSAETLAWLNSNILIGNTAKRGRAWHYSASDQGSEPNHYDGFIPIGDVIRRLFYFDLIEVGLDNIPFVLSDGTQAVTTDSGRKMIVRSDTSEILGVFRDSYTVHPYKEWLLDNLAHLVGGHDELGIENAGLLRKGGVAFVQVSTEETRKNDITGMEFRPFITAATSVDGTLSSTYIRGSQITVCDNTLAAALTESTSARSSVKVKHSRYSGLRIDETRDTLSIIMAQADQTDAWLESLAAQTVTDMQWAAFLDAHVGVLGESASKRAKTENEKVRDALSALWHNDHRVNQWKGTGLGVFQAVNTYRQHESIVRGADGGHTERNYESLLTGKGAESDAAALSTLAAVLS